MGSTQTDNLDAVIVTQDDVSIMACCLIKTFFIFSTKNTILKKYDGRFKDIFQEIYEK